MTKFIREIFALILILGLVACGGGGGSPGNTSGGAEFFVSAPLQLTMLPGETRTFALGGGVPAYTASTGNSIVSATIKDKTLTITALGSGSSTVSVKDATGKEVLITITLGTGLEIYSSAPGDIVVPVGGTSEIFYAGGGSGLYSITSSNTNVATVGLRGNQFVINGVSGGTAKVVVSDSLGKPVNINVIVGSPDKVFTTAGADVQLAVGGASLYKVGGGTTSYFASSTDTSVVTAKIVGNDLLLSGIAVGVATVNVTDTTGTAATAIKVTVGAGNIGLFVTAPANVIIPVNSGAVNYTIGGGKAPYSAVSSNASVATAAVNGTTLTLRGITAGSADIVVTDSAGKPITVKVTVGTGTTTALFTTAPASINIGVALDTDAPLTYTINGGQAPYTVTSANPSVASVVLAGNNFTIKGLAAGTSQIVVKDAAGTPVTINVTVTAAGAATLDVFPNGATGSVSDILTFRVAGGSPNYTITNSNPSIATVTPTSVVANGTFTATLLSAGSTVVTIQDSKGQVKTITITSTQSSPLLRLSPSALSIGEASTNSADLFAYSGTAPYTAYTSDPVRVPVTMTGNKLTIGTVAAGVRCVASDYAVTVTVVDSLGASATSAITIKDANGAAGC